MLSKSDYKKLSASGKKKLKASMAAAMRPSSLRRKVVGRGDYWAFAPSQIMKGKMPFQKVKSLSQGLGAQVGSALAGNTGRMVGAGAHALFKKITGFGDYKVASNSLLTGNEPPIFARNGRGTIIEHREYLGDVLSTSAFTVTSYPINPGLPASFPWASAVAGQYEQFCVRGMIYQFRSTSATSLTSGSSTAMGSVIMATSYDSVSPNFGSESQMLNHEYSTSSVPSRDCLHPIECARGETPVACLYTRSGAVPSGADKRLYDLGNFQIATVGQQHEGDVIGQLWCTYSIELLKPQIGNIGVSLVDHFKLDSTASGTAANLWGTTAPSAQSGSNAGTTLVRAGGASYINFPASPLDRIYNIAYTLRGDTSTVMAAVTGFNAFGGAAAAYNLYGGVSSFQTLSVSDAASIYWFECAVLVSASASASTVTFGGFTTPGTISGGDVIVTVLPLALVSALPPTVSLRSESKEEKKAKVEEEDSDDDDEASYREFLAFQAAKKRMAKAEPPVAVGAGAPADPTPRASSKKGSS